MSMPLSCGGQSQYQAAPAAGGSNADAGIGAGGNAGSSVAVGGAVAAASAGAAGLLQISVGPACDVAGAEACRARIGEAFVDFALGARKGRYTHGCDPQCGTQEIPEHSYELEGSSGRHYLTACELSQTVVLIFNGMVEPSQVEICSGQMSPPCVSYALTDWTTQARADYAPFVGTARAVNLVDPSDASTLTLSYNTCN